MKWRRAESHPGGGGRHRPGGIGCLVAVAGEWGCSLGLGCLPRVSKGFKTHMVERNHLHFYHSARPYIPSTPSPPTHTISAPHNRPPAPPASALVMQFMPASLSPSLIPHWL